MRTSPKIKELSSAKPAAKEKAGKEHSFIDRVFEIARKIPRGRVTSYGAIAESAGIRLSARMVGWAMHAAGSASKPVPAHRVVNSKGLLTGKHHFATPTLMQELLENEGIKVKDNQVQDFKKVFWDPQEEMRPKQTAIKPAGKIAAATKDKVKKATADKQAATRPTGKVIASVTEKAKPVNKIAADKQAATSPTGKAIASVKDKAKPVKKTVAAKQSTSKAATAVKDKVKKTAAGKQAATRQTTKATAAAKKKK